MESSNLKRILLLFVDGVGLGPEHDHNPLAVEPMPHLRQLLGGPLTEEQVGGEGEVRLAALDACLGVDGLPQSATGQTTLFTGRNGAAHLGRHVTAFPGPRLRSLLRDHSIFLEARRAGLKVTFANAFSKRYFELVAARRLRFSASVWAVKAAELPLRGQDPLRRGVALSWDITRDRWARGDEGGVSEITPEEAGSHLAGLVERHHLTVYETFLTDLVGHGRIDLSAGEVTRRLDGLLGGLLAAMPADATLLLTSDHGNFEAGDHRQHTRNPVPLLAHGPLAPAFAGLRSLTEVTPKILACLAGG